MTITIAVPKGPPMPFWIGSPKGDGLWLMYRITILHQRDTVGQQFYYSVIHFRNFVVG